MIIQEGEETAVTPHHVERLTWFPYSAVDQALDRAEIPQWRREQLEWMRQDGAERRKMPQDAPGHPPL